jgi:hypothetical protein
MRLIVVSGLRRATIIVILVVFGDLSRSRSPSALRRLAQSTT